MEHLRIELPGRDRGTVLVLATRIGSAEEIGERDAKGDSNRFVLADRCPGSAEFDLRQLLTSQPGSGSDGRQALSLHLSNLSDPASNNACGPSIHDVSMVETFSAPVKVSIMGEKNAKPKADSGLRFRTVPGKKIAPPAGPGRYDLGLVSAEIEAARKRLNLNVKAAAEAIRVGRKVWYKKRDHDGDSTFNFEDISQLAEAWDAPTGWPYIPWKEGKEFDDWKKKHHKG